MTPSPRRTRSAAPPSARLRPRARRLRVLAALALAALAVALLAHPTLAQQAAALGKDPRNQPYYDDGFCYGHHYPKISPDWVNPTIVADAPAEVVVGVPFTVNLTLRNNWLYHTLPSTAMLNLTGAPNVRIVAEPADETVSVQGAVLRATLQNPTGGRASVPLALPADASRIAVTVTPLTPSLGTPAGPDLDLALRSPDGNWLYSNVTGSAPEVMEMPQDAAVFGGGREWTAVVTYKSGVEPLVNFAVEAAAVREPEHLRHSALASAELREKNETHVYQWTLVATAPGPALLDFRSRIASFHKHSPTDEGHTSDWGNLTRYDTAALVVLGEPRPSAAPESRSLIPLGVGAVVAAVGVAAAVRRR